MTFLDNIPTMSTVEKGQLINKLFLNMKFIKHARQRMHDRKVLKKWAARAIVQGKTQCCSRKRYRSVHKGRTYIYEIKKDYVLMITSWRNEDTRKSNNDIV